jgi:Arc/MetJ-type ribon-helix-helix transcriptional regulator
MAATTEAVTVRLPEEVTRILDELIARGLFKSRSEAIREFCRDYVQEARR